MFDDIGWAVKHVLRDRERLAYLLADGWRTPYELLRFLRNIVPLAASELERIRVTAQTIPDPALRREALASIDGKAYHVAGASILATFLPRETGRRYIEIVAPLETIYDYLDNLCDRHPNVDRAAYPTLHQAICDALDPSAPPRDYYADGPSGNDGGYLAELVTRVQRGLRAISGHELLAPYFLEAAKLYAQMQTFKHYTAGERESACVAWYETQGQRFRELDWHEFACAAGSQFQVYAPLFVLLADSEAAVGPTYDAYFPAACALHVLLDSFIDQAEDNEHGELNFAQVYGSQHALRERVGFLAASFRSRAEHLPQAWQHRFVLRIMTLFYLTHPKVFAQGLDAQAHALLRVTR